MTRWWKAQKAILSIGNLDGIGQIFDNDTNNQGEQAIRWISPLLQSITDAVREGDGHNLTYTVQLNRQTSQSSVIFSVSGDAIGAAVDTPNEVDYLTGSVITQRWSHQQWQWHHHHSCGYQLHSVMPVIDDTLAEETETAVLSIGNRESGPDL